MCSVFPSLRIRDPPVEFKPLTIIPAVGAERRIAHEFPLRGLADLRRRRPARPGRAQPGRERAGLDAGRRNPHRGRAAFLRRRRLHRPPPGHCARRIRRSRRQRHRYGHSSGDPRKDLRPFLHHEGGGEGHRPRTVGGLRDRRADRVGTSTSIPRKGTERRSSSSSRAITAMSTGRSRAVWRGPAAATRRSSSSRTNSWSER